MISPAIRYAPVPTVLIWINLLLSLIYLLWWFNLDQMGNPWLYGLLFVGEIYHVGSAWLFWLTIGPRPQPYPQQSPLPDQAAPRVDVFITVAGEPVEVVAATALAARDMDYPNFRVCLLNDGKVAGKDNWADIEALADQLGIGVITRTTPGGAKAGNINHGLSLTNAELVAILDADMIPSATFLSRTAPFFQDAQLAFVQTPQYYSNHPLNSVTAGSWEQQEFFFGPIMHGKNAFNSAFICGTNVVIRRTALDQAGGMCEDNIAEDFLTSLKIHQLGWKSHYLTEVLCTGLAPQDLMAYYKQQLRWARGSLEVLFGANPLFSTGLSLQQKLQYLSSGLYYLNGLFVLIGLIMPPLFLLLGWQAVMTSSTSFALFFAPYMFTSLYTLYLASHGSLTFRAMSFAQSSWVLQLQALYSVLAKRKMGFAITPKQAQAGNYLSLATPHLVYLAITVAATAWAISQHGVIPAVVANTAWMVFNCIMFIPFIAASYQWGAATPTSLATDPQPALVKDAN